MPEYQAAIDAILSGRGLGARFRVDRAGERRIFQLISVA
jgi:hypothetical protein